MGPSVSVVMPVFNSGQYLSDSIESVLCQTYSDFELLCVDNASTDDSLSVLREESEKDSRISVLQDNRRGVSNARNTGLAYASGDYVAFIDADDFISPSLLEHAISQAQKHSADMVIFGFDEYQSVENSFFARELCEDCSLYERSFTLDEISCLSTEVTTPNVWRILFSRSFLEERAIRFEDDLRTAEDLAFIYKALFSGARIVLLDERLYHYRRDVPTSLTRSNREGDGMKALGHIWSYLEKCGGGYPLKRHFVNLVLDTVRYGLETAADPREYETLFNAYHSKWHDYIAENETMIDDRYRSFFNRIDCNNACHYAYHLYSDMRSYCEDARAHLLKLEEDLRNARASEEGCRMELKDLEASYAFRIGRLLTFLPSRLKAIITGQ